MKSSELLFQANAFASSKYNVLNVDISVSGKFLNPEGVFGNYSKVLELAYQTSQDVWYLERALGFRNAAYALCKMQLVCLSVYENFPEPTDEQLDLVVKLSDLEYLKDLPKLLDGTFFEFIKDVSGAVGEEIAKRIKSEYTRTIGGVFRGGR